MKRMIKSNEQSSGSIPTMSLVFEFDLYDYISSSIESPELEDILKQYDDQVHDELEISFESALQSVKSLIERRGLVIDLDDPSNVEGSVSRYLYIHNPSKENEILGIIFTEAIVKTTDHFYTLKDEFGNPIYDKNGNPKRDVQREIKQIGYYNKRGKKDAEDEILRTTGNLVNIVNTVSTTVVVDGTVKGFKAAMKQLDDFITKLIGRDDE